MSTIRQTIATHLGIDVPTEYRDNVDGVILALESREYNALAVIRQAAHAAGIEDAQLDPVLESAGLVEPTPDPEPEAVPQEGEPTLASVLEKIEEQSRRIDRLFSAAERAGVTVY